MNNVLMQWMERGRERRMNPEGTRPLDGSECQNAQFEFLAGSGITDGNGMWQLDVSTVQCEPLGVIEWVSMVATPSRPPRLEVNVADSFVTTEWSASGGHLRLIVRSFVCRCEPRPHLPFSWHAVVHHVFVAAAK
jgi:hypothetical protein